MSIKNLVPGFSICFIFLNTIFSSFAADFYVSPKGNDKNSGTKQSPFLTIEKAKTAVLKNKSEDCTIWLSDGIYQIEKPILFHANEFGGLNTKITITAHSGANPVISGGTVLEGWKKNKAGLWVAKLKVEDSPRELFIGEERITRARFPNNEYLRVKEVGADRRTHFFFEKDEFPIPEQSDQVELVLLHDWSISRIGVKEIDSSTNKLTAVDSIGAKTLDFFNLDNWEPNPRYYLENAMEFLDDDYEWYYDSKKKRLYLKLPDSLNPNQLQVMVPNSYGLIHIKGEENNIVRNLHFDGIVFKHCAWQIPPMGYCGVQACHFDSCQAADGWTVVPAAIKLDWAENCSFENCTFENLGTSGLWFSTGCENCLVRYSDFLDISGNGIMIGEGRDRLINGKYWWKEAPEQAALGNSIENCSVIKCGAQFYGAVGIWCGLTAETVIKNNEVYDLPYSGISIGWMWSPVPTPCRENIIDGNHIHHILNILSDGGGIYMLGLQPGSKLINNHIHDVKINAGRAESNGMFLDEGTTDVVVANNLIYNIAKSPLRFHKATTNLVKENFLFCTDENPPIRYNNTNEVDIEKVENKVVSDTEKNYKTILQKTIADWKSKK